MAIYVDMLRYMNPRNEEMRKAGKKHGGIWSCMWGDSNTELVAFAQELGLKPHWAHEYGGVFHFDIVPTIRSKAIKKGAVETEISDWLIQRVRRRRVRRIRRNLESNLTA